MTPLRLPISSTPQIPKLLVSAARVCDLCARFRAAISLNQYLDQWLTTAAKPRLRPKSYTDYESLLRLHIRPILETRPLGAIVQFDIQSIYAQMFERGLSARTMEYTNAVLQSAFRQAMRWKVLAEDPVWAWTYHE